MNSQEKEKLIFIDLLNQKRRNKSNIGINNYSGVQNLKIEGIILREMHKKNVTTWEI